eukprot:CAMPEP_0116028188 /NCGR_PEP_ID=MMETSP0321-20121206/15229_1 /TAXON_ID=163516 /ORGANISM="Leptocylindrus danicus var. danicus, Strain B650" /LENGTH=357 /DNA_ID=CAMNT_0003501993 /DNA_START=181 /DNA_END=1254 /DNA_ORIENTATION=-
MTHCGVLEFTAEEGSCYIPFWMMQNLLLEEGALLSVTNVSLPKATFVKLQPQHTDFLEISNPRAVLEHALRNFSCVTKGDVICVPYNNKNYHFMLQEVQPQDAVCIIETDCNVDFDAPVGYVDPSIAAREQQQKSKLASYPKQSATGGYATTPPLTSTANSSSAVSAASSVNGDAGAGAVLEHPNESSSNQNNNSGSSMTTRIVNGEIVTNSNHENNNNTANDGLSSDNSKIDPKLMASQTGATGVQLNAASIQSTNKAATVDYWAVHAGGGARLDGKAATPLKDQHGNEVDVRELRALAAAKRAEEIKQAAAAESSSSSKKSATQQQSRVRQSRVKGKYSKRKNGVGSFHGSGQSM